MLNNNKFLRKGVSLFGTAGVIFGSYVPSSVSNSYTCDDYTIYRFAKFFGIRFFIDLVKKHVEEWCTSANYKKIKEFFEGSKGERVLLPIEEGDFASFLVKTVIFSFGEDVKMKFELCVHEGDPSKIKFCTCLSKDKDGLIYHCTDVCGNLSKDYSFNVDTLRFLENTKFLKEVYDGFVGMELKPRFFGDGIIFYVTDDCRVSIDLKNGLTVPTLKISNTCEGKEKKLELRTDEREYGALSIGDIGGNNEIIDKFSLRPDECQESVLSIDEMRKEIGKIKEFYKKEVIPKIKNGEDLQKSNSQEIYNSQVNDI